MMAGGGGLAGASQKASQVVANPIAKAVTTSMGDNVGNAGRLRGRAGAAGGSVREAGGGPVEQFVRVSCRRPDRPGLTSLATKAYNGIAGAVKKPPHAQKLSCRRSTSR
jgi:hypothetical protein